ncbi:hypothetical protein [Fusibacter ferrireducens]|uniref:Uncharacterized protein n=1 Tax=Fusibacter ferrireducens TaxID=2785058 RepID=A0ABR9ZQM8_9FIRM|nr:hypothetical protein [Fusibacter ferrireducens]MBF4692448.1 hypothetical protein [Fusibacter ferrireducens]
MKKWIILTVIFFIFLISFTKCRYLAEDVMYFSKTNEMYVSYRYAISITNHTSIGKDHAFWGNDKKTGALKYVIFVYRRGTFLVDGSEGVTYENVKSSSTAEDLDVISIYIMTLRPFYADKNIVDYMYWVVEYEDSSHKYIRFKDGVEGSPFPKH